MCNKIVQGANALIVMLASASMLIKYCKQRYSEQTQAFNREFTRSLSNDSETHDDAEAQRTAAATQEQEIQRQCCCF